MRFLLVHQNFPAQFKHLAPALIADPRHQVIALTDAANQRPRLELGPRFATVGYPFEKPDTSASPKLAENFAWRAHRGEAAAKLADQLREKGFLPDVILGHPGWGETMFLKDVFPQARLLLYAESYYATVGSSVGFDPEFGGQNLTDRLAARARNVAQLAALDVADGAITPTQFQRGQFPRVFRPLIEVVHDGIDTAMIKPAAAPTMTLDGKHPLRGGEETITFVNRTLEPSRGYHIFMRALPKVLAARPTARALIIGGTSGASYGPKPPEGKSWQKMFFDEVAPQLDTTRVHFLGKVPYADFLAILQLSAAHVYLTYPTVLSWSMLEAMASGCLVIGSATGPVTEVIEDSRNGLLVDFFDVDGLASRLIEALANRAAFAPLRAAARATVVERYDLARVCLPRQLQLLGAAQESTPPARMQSEQRG